MLYLSSTAVLASLRREAGFSEKFNYDSSAVTGKSFKLRLRGGVRASPEALMDAELTIVIPAKNEVEMLPRLLESLCRQDYAGMAQTRVLVADAGSTDGTVEVALGFRDRLAVEVVPGGLPSVGRNAGAKLATTKYVLFLDADVELPEPTLLRRALWRMERRELHLATTNIACREGSLFDDLLYAGNNLMQRVGSFTKPFATGMFMLFDREVFWSLGGFNERALFAEDYLLSKGVARQRFRIVRGRVLTTNRRFQKLGHWRMVWMFFKTMIHTWDEEYFLEDQGYWGEAG
jgi:glycosyltransferase involved in cell wall biosynthesis